MKLALWTMVAALFVATAAPAVPATRRRGEGTYLVTVKHTPRSASRDGRGREEQAASQQGRVGLHVGDHTMYLMTEAKSPDARSACSGARAEGRERGEGDEALRGADPEASRGARRREVGTWRAGPRVALPQQVLHDVRGEARRPRRAAPSHAATRASRASRRGEADLDVEPHEHRRDGRGRRRGLRVSAAREHARGELVHELVLGRPRALHSVERVGDPR